MLKQSFRDFIFSTNTDGSGKASSYVRALDMLGPILTRHYPKPIINGSMWHSFKQSDIEDLHSWICSETKKGASSAVLADFESPSYWMKNFCSAAILRASHISPWAADDYAKESLDQTGYGCEDPIVLRNWLSTDLYEREGNMISPHGILGSEVLCASMSKAALFVHGSQTNSKAFWRKM